MSSHNKTLSESIEQVAARESLPRTQVVSILEAGIRDAVTRAWGPRRSFEVAFDEAADAVLVYQVVVENDDELLIQVFYRDQDAHSASAQAHPALPGIDELAVGLACPDEPRWLSDLWPHRRLPWRWGQPVTVPGLDEAMDILAAWIERQEPEFPTRVGGLSEGLDEIRGLGEVTRDAVALFERFGPRDDDSYGLGLFGAGLLSPRAALHRRAMMSELLSGGSWTGQANAWSPAWLPIFAGAGTWYCLDLEGTMAGTPGQIIVWLEDDPTRMIDAPSLADWIGCIALAAQYDLLGWDGDNVDVRMPEDVELFQELWRTALPGYPRTIHG